jgi:His/Glu/Gln/Arg/opine family amino acid ABC transporter permease subunit
MTNSQPIFDFQAIWDSRLILLRGFGIAMFSASVAIVLAIVLGLIISLMRLSRVKPFQYFAFCYTQLFRGVPLYVLIIWVYFGLAIVANINIPKIPAGILTLALLNSGYLSETFRSGILAVPSGQREAGEALGLKRREISRFIILPQAFRIVVPPTGNQFVDAIKDSAILSIIGVPELMRMAQQQANVLYRPFEFYTVAGLLYLLAVLIVAKFMTRLDRRLAGYSKSTKNVALSRMARDSERSEVTA